jgi:hypothetical protein
MRRVQVVLGRGTGASRPPRSRPCIEGDVLAITYGQHMTAAIPATWAEQLAEVDLTIDAVYAGGRAGNSAPVDYCRCRPGRHRPSIEPGHLPRSPGN